MIVYRTPGEEIMDPAVRYCSDELMDVLDEPGI